MGFPPRFSSWVISCVQDPKFLILINGQLIEGIMAKCGFRQGCPLSQYLFILCSELISAHIHQNFKELGVPIRRGGPPVSHLLYADDILVFAGASIPNVKKVSSILEEYCSWTGQKVNRSKSYILFSKSTSSSTRSWLAKITGCRKVEEMEYLGIKFALRRLTRKDFAPLLQQARVKTMAWGVRHLSMAGRVTLINSLLIPSYVYLVTHTLVPRGILNEVEKVCRNFLWDADANHKGIHYASWKMVSRPRRMGGLGFHANVNWVGPLREIAWEYISKPRCLLHRCMVQKYGKWPWVEAFKRGDSTVWKLICNGAISLGCCVRWKVVNGSNIDILNHIWIWDRAISMWPTFYDIVAVEDLSVAELITESGNWDVQKLLVYFGEDLVDKIVEIKIWKDLEEDSLELMKIPIGSTVSAMVYNSIFVEEDDPSCVILKMGLRLRERLFWWRIFKNIVPTNSLLHARGFEVDVNCPAGCCLVKDLNHITIKCKQLLEVLEILDGWGFCTPRFSSFEEMLMALERNAYCKDNGGIGMVVRDSYGKLIVEAGWSINHWDSTRVEMMAMQYIDKLLEDWMFDLKGVIIEGDNSSVIKRFNRAAHFCAHRALVTSFRWDIGEINNVIPQDFSDILEEDSSLFFSV
ncbi:uncharacterized protein LOC110109036 [Dendrobium catenatum]|uniref:uncharacterized protein LOC110109036 n=1 Tax=Dendrobium catenatum TaxID=906689 RepID=UPI0009F45EA4|nr:uncharacterized protein LOC110109036 [Dendrobium catenatum]